MTDFWVKLLKEVGLVERYLLEEIIEMKEVVLLVLEGPVLIGEEVFSKVVRLFSVETEIVRE